MRKIPNFKDSKGLSGSSVAHLVKVNGTTTVAGSGHFGLGEDAIIINAARNYFGLHPNDGQIA